MPNPFRPIPPVTPPVEEVKKDEEMSDKAANETANLKTMSDLLAKQAAAEMAEAEGLDKDQTENIIASTKAPTKEPEAKRPRASTAKVAVQSKSTDEIDLDKLDETTLLKYPIIAKSLADSAMVTIKPKSNTFVFRWVYFNLGLVRGTQDKVTATNVGRYKYMGFEFASIEDVDGGEDALTEGIIDDGGKIINYDTVLMKVDKLRLMGHYKQNLLDSISRVDGALGRAVKSAQGEVQQTPQYQKAMSTHPQARIEFFESK